MDDRTSSTLTTKLPSTHHTEPLAIVAADNDAEAANPSSPQKHSHGSNVFSFAHDSISMGLDTNAITQQQKEKDDTTAHDVSRTATTHNMQQEEVDDNGSDMELTQEIRVMRESHEELDGSEHTRTSFTYQSNFNVNTRFEQQEKQGTTNDWLQSPHFDKPATEHTLDFTFLRGITNKTRTNDDDNGSDMLLTQEIPKPSHINAIAETHDDQNRVIMDETDKIGNEAQPRERANEDIDLTPVNDQQQSEQQQNDLEDEDDGGSDMILTQEPPTNTHSPINQRDQTAGTNTIAPPPDEVETNVLLTRPSGQSPALNENAISGDIQSEETPTQERYTGKRRRSSFDIGESDTARIYSPNRTPTTRHSRLESSHHRASFGSPLTSRDQFREPNTVDHLHRISLSPDRVFGSTTAGRDSPLTGRFPTSLLNDLELLSPIAKRGIPSPQRLFSPRRSFYLHGGSPLQRPRPFPRTFERPESQGSLYKYVQHDSPPLDDRSVTSEHLERLISMQGDEQKNILDEEYPQLYNSFSEDIEASPVENRMALHEFFRYVGIVLKELEPVGEMVHTSGYYVGETPSNASEQAVVAATILPELETYKAYTEDLNDLIREDEKSIRRIEGQVIAHNPSLFGEYIFADAATRNRMETMFNAFKDHASVKANQTLYEWMGTVLRSTVDEMKKHLADVEKDLQALSLAESNIRHKLTPAETLARYFEEQLPEAQERERKLPRTSEQRANTDVLEEIRREEEMLQTMSKFEEGVNNEETQAKQTVLALERRSAELEAELAELEQLRLSKGYATEKDLDEAKNRFDADQRLCGWKLDQLNESVVKVTLNDDIHVAIDKQKLESRKSDAIEFSFGSRRPRFYQGFHEFILHGLRESIADVWNLSEAMSKAAIYAGSAVVFVYQVRKVGRLYFTEINEEGGDKLKCTFVAATLAPKAKVTVSIKITTGELRFFPAVNMENVSIRREYGAGSQEDAEAKGRALFEKRGFARLSDTIKEIVAFLASP